MSIVISLGAPGKHTAAYAELRTRQMEADNRHLVAANEDLVCELTRSIIRGCQAEARAAELEARAGEHAATVQRIDEQHAEVVRGLKKQLAEARRRLKIGVLAEAAAAKTQEMSAEEIRRFCAKPIRVITLPQAFGIGPVLNPGRYTT